jgi:predicted acetyltransferase
MGTREPDLLASWFADSTSFPLSILRDAQPVGFALVTRPPARPRERIDYRMAEFYIAQSARRLGIGRDAVHLIFSRFTGEWEVTEFQYNRSAVAFWRSVISQCTRGKYRESVVSGEVRQWFTTSSPRNAN